MLLENMGLVEERLIQNGSIGLIRSTSIPKPGIGACNGLEALLQAVRSAA